EDAVGVDELPAGGLHLVVRVGEERKRRHAAQALVAGREQAADVAEAGGTKHRIDEGVRDDVAVRVPGEPARVVELQPAQDARNAVDEPVRVESDPDAQVSHGARLRELRTQVTNCHSAPSSAASRVATRSRSAWVVTFSSRSSPATTLTRPPPASTRDAQSEP